MPGPLGTNILTEFPGPAENPLSEGGNWTQSFSTLPPLRKQAPGSVVHSSSGGFGSGPVNYSHWVREKFQIPAGTGRGEVFACTLGGQLGAALETWRVALWSEVDTDQSGYLVYFGGALSKDTVIRKYTNGSFLDIAGAGFAGYPSQLALVIDGDKVQAWETFGAGPWILQCEVTDTSYRGSFWGGIGIEDPSSGTLTPSLSIGCFGGGVPNRQQFFRWIFN